MVTGKYLENTQEDEIEEGDDVFDGLQVEERKVGDYECPKFILLEEEEQRIARPWKKCVIVKMLGRRIIFKALETRLNSL